MGVRGLKTFLENEKQTRTVNIAYEVQQWKRHNPGQTPILVIDFCSLANWVARWDKIGNICGGQNQKVLQNWTHILHDLKNTGCSLVFFCDLKIEENKVVEILIRRNYEFNSSTKMYDLIDSGMALNDVSKNASTMALQTSFYGLCQISKKFGKMYYAIERECDVELANYATNNNAMAVISNDTDFLIFAGVWRLWSSQDIRQIKNKPYKSTRVETIEYDRNAIVKICSLSQHQLPLFATIMGNDITEKKYRKTLVELHKNVDPTKAYIKHITKHIFGDASDVEEQTIQQSIDSYNIDYTPRVIDDPIEKQMMNTNMYSEYMHMLGSIIEIIIPFYDMRGCDDSSTLSTLMIDWTKRKIGILRHQHKNHTFTLLTKINIHEDFRTFAETPIFPTFKVPSLDQLYFGDVQNYREIATKRWQIFGWIMSLAPKTISIIRNLPKKFQLICTTLFILVTNRLISIEQADGILHTEITASSSNMNTHLTIVLSKHIRAAHLYNIMFAEVGTCFSIAGLFSGIQNVTQFDGVRFQRTMVMVDQTKSAAFIIPKKQLRIYKNI
ncbi:uncharacterized protein LOC116339756 isoform X2 [Contarinia nasturtii]|uniref:uncharacterized protein LOC116339756 isoform X2 n=1 Tax=Contarinia nasturtii TaxID=265458 RepID=UPI0012D3944C|nr:uncharacterized protein LOC116339756 isoform X2 [Contarinia nasturtii]